MQFSSAAVPVRTLARAIKIPPTPQKRKKTEKSFHRALKKSFIFLAYMDDFILQL